MKQKLYIVYNDETEYVADRMNKSCLVDKMYLSSAGQITEDILLDITNNCLGQFFYIIKSDKELVFREFDFTYRPEIWDAEYVHIWNNDTSVRLFNTEAVRRDPSRFTDQSLENGLCTLKSLPGKIYTYPQFDIIFLSFDESYADENYAALKQRFPRAHRLHNIKGIFEAHKAAAQWVEYNKSDMFFVVDADAVISPTFNFNYQPQSLDRLSVHVWHSKNPVNDLEYGYGGIKLFPTNLLLNYNGSPIDFTTSVSKSFKVIPEVSNITKFNTDPFSAWRSGFRECAKLASKVIHNQADLETAQRLDEWCTKGEDREFGDFTIMGAVAGRMFGQLHKDQPDILGLINDYQWLEKKFSS